MNAELRRVTKTEVWTAWEGQVVNGVFPLRRFLGGSNHSAVFLTEYKARNIPDVAIKFVPNDTAHAEAQLVQWGAAATLSHPHLLRVFDGGRCQLGGRGFLFVVMEYAEQTLAQVLAKRALSPDEIREMLVPTLDALDFLHRNHLVQGQLRPSNVLVVNDQLKLATDTIRSTGNAPSGIARTSSYDPPELKDGKISTAGDLWGLGITLVEALTQRTPDASLLASLPAPFADTARRCLSPTPAGRPTVIELQAQYKPAPRPQVMSVSQPPTHEPPPAATRPRNSRKKGLLLPIAAALLLSVAVWAGLRFFAGTRQADGQPPTAAEPAPDTAWPQATLPAETASLESPSPDSRSLESPPAVAQSAEANASSSVSNSFGQPSVSPDAAALGVLHAVTPEVPPAIQNKIRGSIKVTVRVLVDPSGNVVGQLLEKAGPSRYFARLAGDAAAEWKFAPADTQASRVWLLRFDFTPSEVTVETAAAE
jgi:serine/threonine protein kinase